MLIKESPRGRVREKVHLPARRRFSSQKRRRSSARVPTTPCTTRCTTPMTHSTAGCREEHRHAEGDPFRHLRLGAGDRICGNRRKLISWFCSLRRDLFASVYICAMQVTNHTDKISRLLNFKNYPRDLIELWLIHDLVHEPSPSSFTYY